MKTLKLSAILFCLLVGPAWSASFAPGLIIVDNVNVRAGPSLRAEIVGQLQKDQGVEVIAMDGEWCAIAPPPGLAGWISADYIKEGVITGSRVNIRSGPGVAYASLGKFESGERPEVLEATAGWTKVALPRNLQVWVNARHVQLGQGAASIPRLSPSPICSPPEPQLMLVEARTPPPLEPVPLVTPCPSAQPAVTPPPPSEPLLSGSPPFPVPPPAGTPFRPRIAPSYTPLPGVAPVRSYLGYLRELEQPYESGGRKATHELVKVDQRGLVIGHLTSQGIDLNRYRNRKVRLWAEVIPEEDPIPLLDVKGIQVMW